MLCRAASALGPVVVALARLQGQARWGDELAIIRGLGLMQVGGEGVVSSALASGLAAVPIGSTVFRLTLLNPLLAGVAGAEPRYFYHVHSYARLEPSADELLGECEYDARFGSIVGGDGVWGAQFHPEKSQEAGLRILHNFGRI